MSSLSRKSKAAVNLKTGRFDNINSAVISSVSKTVLYCLAHTADIGSRYGFC